MATLRLSTTETCQGKEIALPMIVPGSDENCIKGVPNYPSQKMTGMTKKCCRHPKLSIFYEQPLLEIFF